MKLLIGTNNQHKFKEFQSVLITKEIKNLEIITHSSLDIANFEPIENANNLEGNALNKAKGFFEISGIPCIADDTGLEIEALNGAPGVYSARFAGEPTNDFNNREKVLRLLENFTVEKRIARFRTVICLYGIKIDIEQNKLSQEDNQILFDNNIGYKFFSGVCNGSMSLDERGKNGFGYDSIFIPDGYNKTFAELSSAEKNEISHRGRAIDNLCHFLQNCNPI